MFLNKKKVGLSVAIARRELRKKRKERKIFVFLSTIVIIFTSLLFIFLTARLLITGYQYYVQANGGYITQMMIHMDAPTQYWTSVYGIALRVPGFTEQLYKDLENAQIEREDLFFDCLKPTNGGNTVIFASISPNVDFNNISAAPIWLVDNYTGCFQDMECANNTYQNNMTVILGNNTIKNVPATFTYKMGGNRTSFDIGVLNDSRGNLVFVTHLTGIQKGYSKDITVNYQMLLPVINNTLTRYYFYSDPLYSCPVGGGVTENIFADVYGYVNDPQGNVLSGAFVTISGAYDTTGPSGFYNLTFGVQEGNYTIIATKSGYKPYVGNVSITTAETNWYYNITLTPEPPISRGNETINPHVHGYVTDELGNVIEGATIMLGGSDVQSDNIGYYEMYPLIYPTPQPIIAIKVGYDNFYTIVNFTINTTDVEQNITLKVSVQNLNAVNLFQFPTGPTGVLFVPVLGVVVSATVTPAA